MSPSKTFRFEHGHTGRARNHRELHSESLRHLPTCTAAVPGQPIRRRRHTPSDASSQVFVAREGTEIIAMFQLTTKKPWAIDTSYFAD